MMQSHALPTLLPSLAPGPGSRGHRVFWGERVSDGRRDGKSVKRIDWAKGRGFLKKLGEFS